LRIRPEHELQSRLATVEADLELCKKWLRDCHKSKAKIGDRCLVLESESDELQRHCESYISAYDAILADLKIMEQKLNDLQVENSRLIRIGEERHIRAKDTEEGLMEHVERLQAENERLLRCLADYPAGNQTEPDVKAALREVDGGKD